MLGCCIVTCQDARDAADSSYTFSLNGEPIHPRCYSLDGDPAHVKPGDVIAISSRELAYAELFLTLGKQRVCWFVTKPEDHRRLFLMTRFGRLKVIGAIVEPVDRGVRQSRQAVAVNPLAEMSRSQIRDLWGIHLKCWPPGFEKYLALINTDRACVTVSGSAVYGDVETFTQRREGKPFPSLDPRLRYLVVEDIGFFTFADYSALGRLNELVFASFQMGAKEGIDMRLISQSRSLRCLVLQSSKLANTEAMSQLTELRVLDVSYCTGLDNIDFARTLNRLKVLSVPWAVVTSLSPLDNSVSIQEIDARRSNVKDLPQGDLPSLKMLNVLSSRVEKDVAEQFAQAHPQSVVHYSWKGSLQRAVEGANRLRVRPHLLTDPGKVLFETTDPNGIRQLVDHIEIDEAKSGGHIKEDSLRVLEFYKGDELLARIGCVYLKGLRWEDDGPWPGDGILTGKSKSFLGQWLQERGANVGAGEY
jgi:hypothetical protein